MAYQMNKINIKVLTKYSEHLQDNWSMQYKGTQSKEEVISDLKKILEPHEEIIEVIELDGTEDRWKIHR
jgi:hypothetical protein